MRIGTPKEIKSDEHRVGLTPAAARELASGGHTVLVERGARVGAGFPDRDYAAAGARIVDSASALYAEAELIVKVKEPQPDERAPLRRQHALVSPLHPAAD